jgi:LmbE family N-acetylglucosaminyl deacetylase
VLGWIGTGRRVLVVAAHPDDDVIGCGGALYGLARAGIQPTVLYVTDGRASHPNSVRFPPSRLALLREDEARAALRELGISTPPIFLRVHDGTLSALEPARRKWLVQQMCDTMSSSEIDTVLGPWPQDPHNDHVATAGAIRSALRLMKRSSMDRRVPRSLYYSVWTAVRGGEKRMRMLDEHNAFEIALDECAVDAKQRALLQHRSQTGPLIDDDPQGFGVDETLMKEWLRPVEVFYEERG